MCVWCNWWCVCWLCECVSACNLCRMRLDVFGEIICYGLYDPNTRRTHHCPHSAVYFVCLNSLYFFLLLFILNKQKIQPKVINLLSKNKINLP